MNPLHRIGISVLTVLALCAGALIWHSHTISKSIAQGRQIERGIWMEKEAKRNEAEKQALAAHAETVRLLQKAHDARNLQVANAHEKSLAALRENRRHSDVDLRAGGGLRVPRSICNSLASRSETAGDGDHDAYLAASVQLPASIERFLKSEADRADEIVEIARECQNWVITHGFYGSPAP